MTPGSSFDWPDSALRDQAGTVGPALLEAIDNEARWVHRRVERIELPSAVQVARSIATDLTVPTVLATRLRLYAERPTGNPQRDARIPSRIVVPLGTLGKAPLIDFSITPADAHRLSAAQVNPLVVSALAPYARSCGADAERVLALLARIILSEVPRADLVSELEQLLDQAGTAGSLDSRERLRTFGRTLSANYILVAALKIDPGIATRVSFIHRQSIPASAGGFGDPPLVLNTPLPHASGRTPYRVEVVAPDGLEIETASIIDLSSNPPQPIEGQNFDQGEGAFAHLRAPDRRPESTGLNAVCGFPAGGVHHVTLIAGIASLVALGLGLLLSAVLAEKLKGSAASSLLAAPALVTGIALGFATTRVTSRPVNRLRGCAALVAVLGVLGGLTIAVFSENPDYQALRAALLVVWLVLASGLVWAGPGRAFARKRAQIKLADVRSSNP